MASRMSMRPESRARVLVVEDSETIREMVSEALGDAGYATGARADGAGLEQVLQGFRLVLPVRPPIECHDDSRSSGRPQVGKYFTTSSTAHGLA